MNFLKLARFLVTRHLVPNLSQLVSQEEKTKLVKNTVNL